MKKEKLPRFLVKYFWDVEFDQLDLQKNRIYILRRILEYGDKKSVNWMLKKFDRSEIKNVLASSRDFSQKSANFWALILNLSPNDILCLKRHLLKKQEIIWPY